MRKIRALVVDDSVVVRRLVSDLLAADPAIDVAGVAANGRIALAKIPQVTPDVVVLDVDMPVMNGLDALSEMRRLYPQLPVLMFSTLTERGADATLEALFRGAADYVTKPANMGSPGLAAQAVRDELIPKIKALCYRVANVDPPGTVARPPQPLPKAILPGPPPAIGAIAIGASTGGPNALQVILAALPSSFDVPIVIAQHMPPAFTRYLAQQLDTKTSLTVMEGYDGAPVESRRVWIAPGDNHMSVERRDDQVVIKVWQGPPENSCRPAADVLLRSVADVYGRGALAVVLTGMGRDGLRGCESVRAAGGQVVVQDQASSVVWGMPGFVASAGLADAVCPLTAIARELENRVVAGRLSRGPRPAKAGGGGNG